MLSLLLVLSFGLAEGSLYVLPASSSPAECPADPCLTLEEYAQESSRYFTANSSFLFLPGCHSLSTALHLTAVSNISFRGTENGTATITCASSITVDTVTNFHVHGVVFQLLFSQQEGIALSSALVITRSQEVVISEAVFQRVKRTGQGRAINCTYCKINILNCFFEDNTGQNGGAIFAQRAIFMNLTGNVFARNEAERFGGAVYGESSVLYLIGNSFTDNSAADGGGALYCLECNWTRLDAVNNFTRNFLTGNEDSVGGAIAIRGGYFNSRDHVNFISNRASKGGAVSLIGVEADFSTYKAEFAHLYVNNTAISGGALYAFSSEIKFDGIYVFTSNSAKQGGAMYLLFGAILNLQWYSQLHMTDNTASEYGGAIYHEDFISDIQCGNVSELLRSKKMTVAIPNSFLQIDGDVSGIIDACPSINSSSNTACKDGNFLYGGLLDRSKLRDAPTKLPYNYFTSTCNITMAPQSDTPNDIASAPFELELCGNNSNSSISVYKGERFSLQVGAIGQGHSHVPAQVIASVSQSARLELNQSSQAISEWCSVVTYNLYSTESQEVLTLYPQGSCTGGLGSVMVAVTFRPCPNALNESKSSGECVCEDRLRRLNATCEIDEKVRIRRYEGVKFWINASHDEDGLYQGLIVSPSCPAEYCTAQTVSFSLDDPDAQCNSHRTGVLCGKCAANFSLLLGGSRCDRCSNVYLLLILPFALAGIGLVVLLSVTRLTVAAGTLNSLILYANFVQVNRQIFFPSNETNPLTVFVAWMNLDFGFQICFFDGMDSFSRSLLQFLFPLYVITLSSLIALLSRYSTTLSKLIGPNPIAIVATLLLMSFSKILKTSVDVFFFANLEYPDLQHITVWAKDGNLTYFHSKHLLLALLSLLVLLSLLLPYSLFVFLGHLFLYHKLPHRKYYSWLFSRAKPLLVSYYAPYKPKTRCWTGLLLSVRCVLYITFSFDAPGIASYNLLAIILAFSLLLALTWLAGGLYRHFHMDLLEVSLYLNLISLSAVAATLPEPRRGIVTHVLVGAFLATAVVAVAYQIHLTYIATSALWLSLRSKMPSYRRAAASRGEERDQMPQPAREHPSKEVTKTVINLYSPLVESKEMS